MAVVVLDTDVASAILRHRLPGSLQAELQGGTAAITFVTVAELTKWRQIRAWGPRRMADMAQFMSRVVVLPYNPLVATTWGDIQAAAHLRGRPRPVNDAWIAACCLVWQLPLVTYNIKDFEDFAEHDGLKLITG